MRVQRSHHRPVFRHFRFQPRGSELLGLGEPVALLQFIHVPATVLRDEPIFKKIAVQVADVEVRETNAAEFWGKDFVEEATLHIAVYVVPLAGISVSLLRDIPGNGFVMDGKGPVRSSAMDWKSTDEAGTDPSGLVTTVYTSREFVGRKDPSIFRGPD